MATIKSYTDIDQSKKLAEILPIESADMFYIAGKGEPIFIGNKMVAYGEDDYDCLGGPDVLCWSLAALLDVIPDSIYDNTNEFSQLEFSKRSIAYHDLNDGIKIGSLKDNLVDACYELILKLHELNLL